jgi:hypothetical protein
LSGASNCRSAATSRNSKNNRVRCRTISYNEEPVNVWEAAANLWRSPRPRRAARRPWRSRARDGCGRRAARRVWSAVRASSWRGWRREGGRWRTRRLGGGEGRGEGGSARPPWECRAWWGTIFFSGNASRCLVGEWCADTATWAALGVRSTDFCSNCKIHELLLVYADQKGYCTS